MNPYAPFKAADFKSAAYTDFATRASSHTWIISTATETGDSTSIESPVHIGATNEGPNRDSNLDKVALDH